MALAPHFRTTRFEPGPDSTTGNSTTGTSTPRVIDTDAPLPAVCLSAGILQRGVGYWPPSRETLLSQANAAGQPLESIRLPIRSKTHCMQSRSPPARRHAHAFGVFCFAPITTPTYLPTQVCGFNDAAPASGPTTEEIPETSGLLTRSPGCVRIPVVGVASQAQCRLSLLVVVRMT